MLREEAITKYNVLIENAKVHNPKKRTYGYERHHIVPKCKSIGGSLKDPENLVYLTIREHVVAHIFLCYVYETGRQHWDMCNALERMYSGQEKHFFTIDEVVEAKLLHAKTQSERAKNGDIGFKKGVKQLFDHSAAGHASMANRTFEQQSFAGKRSGIGENAKIAAKIVRTCVVCGLIGRGNNMLRYHFDNCGKPRQHIKRTIITCPHCELSGTSSNMKRYHFNNCKKNDNI